MCRRETPGAQRILLSRNATCRRMTLRHHARREAETDRAAGTDDRSIDRAVAAQEALRARRRLSSLDDVVIAYADRPSRDVAGSNSIPTRVMPGTETQSRAIHDQGAKAARAVCGRCADIVAGARNIRPSAALDIAWRYSRYIEIVFPLATVLPKTEGKLKPSLRSRGVRSGTREEKDTCAQHCCER